MESTQKEARILLALQALKKSPKQSARSLAKAYNIPRITLHDRKSGRPARTDRSANSRKLTDLEESVIVREVLDLYSRGFPSRLGGVGDMADKLRTTRGASRVGPRWASNFVKRHQELRTRFTRKYDYQRAKCEDPTIIQGWFNLVQNIKAKYGILDDDIWNFDETGFMMGQISSVLVVTSSEGRGRAKMVQPGNREWVTVIQGVNSSGWAIPPFIVVAGKHHLASWYRDSPLPSNWVIALSDNGWTTNEIGLNWVKHFDQHSHSRTKGIYRLLVLDGHESHHSIDFEDYCKENNIITLCMPAHSSHLLQPLDVGCFSPLKRSYGKEIENLIRTHVTHITKVEFFTAFKNAFFVSLSEENVRGGFRGAGLVPFSPDAVLSKLDVKLQTPTPPRPSTPITTAWVSKTPQTAYEAASQSDFIKRKVARHQDSSPTAIYEAMDQMVKGTTTIMHQMVLMKDRIRDLEEANRTLSKRRREKKTRIRQGGSLTIRDAQDVIDQRDIDQQVEQEKRTSGGRTRGGELTQRRCGTCGKPGHNARTCQGDEEMSNVYSSE
jgi:hypothetical protein